jgi:hypothetical protein
MSTAGVNIALSTLSAEEASWISSKFIGQSKSRIFSQGRSLAQRAAPCGRLRH